jgi:hypothetical protein
MIQRCPLIFQKPKPHSFNAIQKKKIIAANRSDIASSGLNGNNDSLLRVLTNIPMVALGAGGDPTASATTEKHARWRHL